MTNLLEVADLSVRFPGGRGAVLSGVSFALRRGECLALIGESGCGKSVTLRTLVGLTGPGAVVAAQRLAFDGEDATRFSAARWREIRGGRIGFVLQDALGSLDPLRPVGEEVGEVLRLHRRLTRDARRDKVHALLRDVGVPEPELRALQYPHQLSGGLRQRALIASAIAAEPELLIADEPTTALDTLVQAQILELLAQLRTRGTAIILVSHDLGVADRLADRVAVMERGRIVESAATERVLRKPRHPYTASLLAAARAVHAGAPVSGVTEPVDQPPVELEIRNVRKSFARPGGGRTQAVAGVSLKLRSSRTLGIVGGSGSGKTTLSRIILGLERADEGQVLIRGQDREAMTATELRAARRRIQVVFQDPLASFDPRYTVERVIGEALEVAGYRSKAARRARAVELLDLVRLGESYLTRRPLELSGGQRQRVAIARALAAEPAVLVCDEPVSALDLPVQAQILALLAELKDRLGLACLFISHDLGVIRRVSDEVVVLENGVVVETGAAAEILGNPAHHYTRGLVDAIPRLRHAAA